MKVAAWRERKQANVGVKKRELEVLKKKLSGEGQDRDGKKCDWVDLLGPCPAASPHPPHLVSVT